MTPNQGAASLVERLRAELMPERHEEIMKNGWDKAAWMLRSGHKYGDEPRLIAESWMMDGKDDLIEEAASTLSALEAENVRLRIEVEAAKLFGGGYFGAVVVEAVRDHYRQQARALNPIPEVGE